MRKHTQSPNNRKLIAIIITRLSVDSLCIYNNFGVYVWTRTRRMCTQFRQMSIDTRQWFTFGAHRRWRAHGSTKGVAYERKRTHERHIASESLRSPGRWASAVGAPVVFDVIAKIGGGVNRIRNRNNCIYFVTKCAAPEGIQKEISLRAIVVAVVIIAIFFVLVHLSLGIPSARKRNMTENL